MIIQEWERLVTEPQVYRGQILNTTRGAMIFIVYGTLWAIFGLWSLGRKVEPIPAIALGIAALLLFVVTIKLIRQTARLPQDVLSQEVQARVKRIKRAFGIISLIQGIAIGAAFMIGFNSQRPFYIPPAVAFIVGLHFFALAPLLRIRFDYLIGTLLCVLVLVTVLALPIYANDSEATTERTFVWGACIGIGTAMVLWSGAVARLLNVRAALTSWHKAHP